MRTAGAAPWTAQADAILRGFVEAGWSDRQIADSLGKTMAAVRSRRRWLLLWRRRSGGPKPKQPAPPPAAEPPPDPYAEVVTFPDLAAEIAAALANRDCIDMSEGRVGVGGGRQEPEAA